MGAGSYEKLLPPKHSGRKTVWQLLKTLTIESLYHPAIAFVSTDPRELNTGMQTDTGLPMYFQPSFDSYNNNKRMRYPPTKARAAGRHMTMDQEGETTPEQ